MDDATAKYGIRPRTGKPIRHACHDLSQAINGLHQHAEEAPAAFDLAYNEALTANAGSEQLGTELARSFRDFTAVNEALRVQRRDLLEVLLPLREPLVDVLLEENDSRPGGLQGGVAPYEDPTPAPRPLTGIELSPRDHLRVLSGTLEWTMGITKHWVLRGIGPAYALSWLIEHPTPEARHVREAARDVHQRLVRVAASPGSPGRRR